MNVALFYCACGNAVTEATVLCALVTDQEQRNFVAGNPRVLCNRCMHPTDTREMLEMRRVEVEVSS